MDFGIALGIVLGLGVLALTAVCLVLLIRKRGFSLRRHPRRIAMLILGAVLVAVSVFPTFAFGDQLLIRIPLSRRMNNLLGIFRSNGRFIWPVIYIIIFSAGRFLERQSARYITLICALALIAGMVYMLFFRKYKEATKLTKKL